MTANERINPCSLSVRLVVLPMVIFEMSREELAEFYAKIQNGGKSETFAACDDMKQQTHVSQYEGPTDERHSPINPSTQAASPVGSEGGGMNLGYGQIQPRQVLHLQHYKPNGPATFSQDFYRTNQQWTALASIAQQQRGEMGMEQVHAMPEGGYNQTPGCISPHSIDSYTQLPTIANISAGIRYLQSEPLPSIISQHFQQIPVIAGTSIPPTRPVYPPNIYIPQQQYQSNIVQCEDPNGNEQYLTNQNYPVSYQPGSSSSPSFAYLQNVCHSEDRTVYPGGEYYPNAISAHNPPAYYAHPQLWAVSAPGPSSVGGEWLYYNGHREYAPNPGYTCNLCYKAFPTRYRLKSHSLVHTAVKAFQCDVCKKNFGRSHDLRRHMKLHTSEKIVKTCSSCGKAFSRSDALQRHLRLACKRDVPAVEPPNLPFLPHA